MFLGFSCLADDIIFSVQKKKLFPKQTCLLFKALKKIQRVFQYEHVLHTSFMFPLFYVSLAWHWALLI